jgi:uncharacterized membrane protein (UPF0127 family)
VRQGLAGLVLALLLSGAGSRTWAAGAAPRPAGLPRGSHVLSQVALPARANAFAAIYAHGATRVAVLRGPAHHRRLLWSHSLPPGTATLAAPGPHGVFLVLVKVAPARVDHLFAYRLRNGAVSSVISGDPSGELTGDEGVRVHGESFATRNQDAQHVGSVSYRFVAHYAWTAGLFREVGAQLVPDYPRADYPLPNATVRTARSDVVLLRLQIADTEQERELGLMYRSSLDPDTGMIFVWPQDTQDSFWMANTLIPLSVAFLSADGQIQEIQDMTPLSTVLHTPVLPYRYAIEVNQGFFTKWGIHVGDSVQLHLA